MIYNIIQSVTEKLSSLPYILSLPAIAVASCTAHDNGGRCEYESLPIHNAIRFGSFPNFV